MTKEIQGPVEILINEFGGVRATARKMGLTPGAINKWRLSGRIPTSSREKVLAIIEQEDLKISSHELDFGRVVVSSK